MKILRSSILCVLSCCTLLFGTAHASEHACLEGPLAQFGRYVGDWKIEDQSLAQDGSAWAPGKGARWTFECVGDGAALQDFWMPNSGGWGTNLRTYNPDTGSWEIVWATQGQKGLMHISARQEENGNVVMDVLKPAQPQPRRITFMVPDDNGWDWVMEWSFDEGKTWTPVYKIRATPWSAEGE